MDQINPHTEALLKIFQERIKPSLFNQNLFKMVRSESRKNKDIAEAEKLIRKRMREIPKDSELFVVIDEGKLLNGVYVPGIKVKKISMAKHYMCVKLPDGLITEMHYKQLGTNEIQVTRKLFGI